MVKNVHLAIFINEYGKEPIFHDLMEFKDAVELDQFMYNYYDNNKEVRKKFIDDIAEYLLDNRDQVRKVEKKTGNKFYGRISAYYISRSGKMEYLELPTPKRVVVRDYKEFPDIDKAYAFLLNLFEKTVMKINEIHKKSDYGSKKGNFIYLMCEEFHKYGYEFSEEELYHLAKYHTRPNEKNREDCLTIIMTNLKRYYGNKPLKTRKVKKENQLTNDDYLKKEELEYSSLSPDNLQYDMEKVKETDDYDYLYLNHDLDEIDKYTNALKRGK